MNDDLAEDGILVSIHRIEKRTTKMITRDEVKLIIPNSLLVGNTVMNWGHNKRPARFNVVAGVAFGSNIKLVEEILLDCTKSESR